MSGDGNCVAEDTMLSSNFAGARPLLERAFVALHGKDEFSIRAREALNLLIAARFGDRDTAKRVRPASPC